MTISRWWIIGLLLLVSLSSCKSLKDLGGKSKGETATLKALKRNNLQFTTLSISGKGKAEMAAMKFNMGISYKLDLYVDSLIRIRVTKLGFEGARILITQDSIYILNRLNKTYTSSDYSLAKKFTGLDADFGMLQALILGDFAPIPDQLEYYGKAAPQLFRGMAGGTDFAYKLRRNPVKVMEIEATNKLLSQHTIIQYNEFKEVEEQFIPNEGAVNVISPEKAGFDFKHSRVNLNPSKISFKFNIPDNYERAKM